MTPQFVVIGNLLLDDVVYADGRTRMAQAGGATLYAALGAALWEVEVGVVSVVGADYPAEVLEALGERGVDLAGVRRLEAPTLRTWLLYEGRRRRVVHRLDGPTHTEVSPEPRDLPPRWGSASCLIAPMPWSTQRALLNELEQCNATPVAVDPFELLTTDRVETWRRELVAADVLFLSEDELLVDGGLENPRPVLQELTNARLGTIFLKRGARGGLVYDASSDRFAEWAVRADEVVDATGAGDAFAGGVLAGVIRDEPLAKAIERGVVSASYALAGIGADALLRASPQLAQERHARWFGR